jgi:hypothetical protein
MPLNDNIRHFIKNHKLFEGLFCDTPFTTQKPLDLFLRAFYLSFNM